MEFRLTDANLECLEKGEWQIVGGWIRVVARTRRNTRKQGFGALIQWRNMDSFATGHSIQPGITW